MTLSSGVRLGPYEIQAPLGAGGMGEVYRARDTRLGREVAIKILPEFFARDPERLHRFERETRAVATLNHPNILAIYDVGQHESVPFLVSELLEGESLRQPLSSLKKWNPVRAGDERFRKSPQRGQRAVVSTVLATMPAIASTGAMLFTGHKGTSGKSALARRTESSIRFADTAAPQQVSGTSDYAQGVINCFL